MPEEQCRIESDRKREEELNYADRCREYGTDDEPLCELFPRTPFLKHGKRDKEEWGEREKEGEFPKSPRSTFRKKERKRRETKKGNKKNCFDACGKRNLSPKKRLDEPEAKESDRKKTGNVKVNSGCGTEGELKGECRKKKEEKERHERISSGKFQIIK